MSEIWESYFLKTDRHAHLGELNSEKKNQLLRFVFLSFFATFKITPDQNAIFACFASRFY